MVVQVEENQSSNNWVEQPKLEKPKQTKVPRSKSYNAALRRTIFINFTESNESSYSFWNHAYSSLDKRNTLYEDRQDISLDIRNAKTKSLISL